MKNLINRIFWYTCIITVSRFMASLMSSSCFSKSFSKFIKTFSTISNLRLLCIVMLTGSMLLLSGCSHLIVLNPKGVIAVAEKKLLIDAVLLMLIIVVPVIVLTFVIARRYRSSNLKAKYTPNWSHSVMLELIWWSIPLAIIIVLATLTWISTHKLDPYRPLDSKTKPMIIQVVALDWRWLFIYPEQNIATINFVEFPVNKPVTFVLTADAPMNSFQIAQLGGQIYAMPGMATRLNLMANEIGDYSGRSVNFSGDGFADMTFVARVSSEEGFEQWVETVKQSSQALTFDVYNQLVPNTEDSRVRYFSSATPNLFDKIIMKFMVPSSGQNNFSNANHK